MSFPRENMSKDVSFCLPPTSQISGVLCLNQACKTLCLSPSPWSRAKGKSDTEELLFQSSQVNEEQSGREGFQENPASPSSSAAGVIGWMLGDSKAGLQWNRCLDTWDAALGQRTGCFQG